MSQNSELNDPDLRFVAVTAAQLQRAQAIVQSCQACNPDAEIPFDWLLHGVVGEPENTGFVIPAPAKCPRCFREIHEKTLVEMR